MADDRALRKRHGSLAYVFTRWYGWLQLAYGLGTLIQGGYRADETPTSGGCIFCELGCSPVAKLSAMPICPSVQMPLS